MNFFAMKRGCTIGAMALVAAVLAACGGGGGSAGENPNAPYDLRLTAEVTKLPLNLNLEPPSFGGPFTTTLVIDAIASNRPIPTGNFFCTLDGGVNIGGLYKLDSTDAVVDGVIQGSRSLDLNSNSGMATFHFHGENVNGTATIRCSLADNQNRIAEISIKVGEDGGAPTGAYIATTTTGSRGYVLTQNVVGDTVGPLKQLTMQATVVNANRRPVANPVGNNLRVSIMPNAPSNQLAAQDAQLRSVGSLTGSKVLYLATVNGRATFTIVSGNEPGPIALELISDADNNVDNGISNPVVSTAIVYAVNEIPSAVQPEPLTIAGNTTFTAPIGREFFQALTAEGGISPYTWQVESGSLPNGLELTSSGVILGTPTSLGTSTAQLVVRDSAAGALPPSSTQTARASVTITVERFDSDLAIVCAGATLATSTCDMTNALVGLPYLQALSARGGTGTYVWQVSQLPSFLTFDTTNLQIRSTRSLTCADLNISVVTTETKDPENPEAEPIITTTTTYTDRTYGYFITLSSGTETISTLARMTVNKGNAVCN